MDEHTSVLCTFRFLCDKQWGDLNEISDTPNVRFCSECAKAVFLCVGYDELREHISESHCVAIQRDDGFYLIGDPK